MSWHTKTHRMTFIHQAILTALFGLVSLHAHAITLSQADIHSSQHEPLSATIAVSDIDANNFNVSIATADIYAQMGLSPEAPISVKFNATSESSGQIILTSSTPISTPFADVVLNLNNNGEQVIEPQTLLMPIPTSSPFTIPDNELPPILITEEQQNLPMVTPTLPDAPAVTAELSPTTEAETKPALTGLDTNTKPTNNPASGRVISKADDVLTKITPEGTNTQIDILTEHVTKSIYPAGQAPQDTAPATTQEPTLAQNQEGSSAEVGTGSAVYVVQSGDSLWNIANQLAKANNVSVNEVMNAIHKANPDAFNKGNINHLKANAKLSLPSYNVIPSQKAIQDAIANKRHHESKPKQTGKASDNVAKASRSNHAQKPTHNTTVANKKPLPRAQMTLVTPTQQGKATGTNNKATQSQTSGNNALVGTLKNTRQQTVSTAQRVNGLNQELSTATQKLQLQNQKLAELEARLKALKENQ
ncbi:type IV pilus assembly protein FimV [Moraxella oblonga]|uniref:type IV pilus assembly protein FimV n=1 Tax=Moraxella oblonga TaxID=200413 RepID=UPI00083095FE|nr:FimV/HubP family polar landmark protein [Moraxella oblonga]